MLEKIAKLLALAQSDNPHEAALALKHAQRLMKEHHLTESEVIVRNVTEAESLQKSTTRWELVLAQAVSRSFGTFLMTRREVGFVFVGLPVDVVVSLTCYESLRISAHAKSVGEQDRGDWLLGYASAILRTVEDLTPCIELQEWINQQKFGKPSKLPAKRIRASYLRGFEEGKKVRLHRNQLD